MAPPLRFPVGLLCRFSADDMDLHFFAFFLLAQVWSLSKLMTSLQVFQSSSSSSHHPAASLRLGSHLKHTPLVSLLALCQVGLH